MTRLMLIPLLLACMLWACTHQYRPHGLPNAGGATLHATQDVRLRDLMVDLNSLLFERIHTELDAGQGRVKAAEDIARDAIILAKAVSGISAAMPRLNLTADQQTTFKMLAQQLKDRAEHLAQLARQHRYEQLHASLDEIDQTCAACHRLFRTDPP